MHCNCQRQYHSVQQKKQCQLKAAGANVDIALLTAEADANNDPKAIEDMAFLKKYLTPYPPIQAEQAIILPHQPGDHAEEKVNIAETKDVATQRACMAFHFILTNFL